MLLHVEGAHVEGEAPRAEAGDPESDGGEERRHEAADGERGDLGTFGRPIPVGLGHRCCSQLISLSLWETLLRRLLPRVPFFFGFSLFTAAILSCAFFSSKLLFKQHFEFEFAPM